MAQSRIKQILLCVYCCAAFLLSNCNGKIFKDKAEVTIDTIWLVGAADLHVGVDVSYDEDREELLAGGICWKKESAPASVAEECFISEVSASGSGWSDLMTDFESFTNYYFRAYAVLSRSDTLYSDWYFFSLHGIWEFLGDPGTESFYTLWFTSPEVGQVAGSNGVHYRTTDGGLNWTPIDHGSTANIREFEFPDENTGYMICSYVESRRSTDGGITWTDLSIGSTEEMLCIDFSTTTNGCVSTEDGIIHHTSDGGDSWTPVSLPISASDRVMDIHFINSSTGFGCSYEGVVVKSTDGGVSWSALATTTLTAGTQIWFLDETTGFLSRQGSIFKTSNGGLNWTEVHDGSGTSIYTMYFYDNTVGYCGGGDGGAGHILRTDDGGETWKEEYCYPSASTVLGIQMFAPDFGYAAIGNGMVLVYQ